ncbi:MAG: serine hydrolase domain-containing protein [Acidimicrobiales bacterium]
MSEQRVVDAMARALNMGEVGLQVCAQVGDEVVFDGCAGTVDVGGPPVTADTLFCVFSVTKAVVATAAHLQAERGLLRYEALVTEYWPGYGRNGKEATTVADVLCHRSGVPQMPAGVTPERMCDWDWMIAQIEDFTPVFPPGTTNAYHELVWGWLVGELVRRTDPARRPLATFIRDEVCQALGIDDLHLGVPPSELHRVAPVISDRVPGPSGNACFDESMPAEVFPGPAVHNLELVRTGVVPGAGVIMSARAGARFFSLLAGGGATAGVRLLSANRVRSFAQPRPDAHEVDKVMGWVAWVGVGGYWLGGKCPPAYPVLGPNPHVLAHPGIGGSIGWADPDTGLAVSICHNWMQPDELQGSNDPAVNPLLDIADAVRALVPGGRCGSRLRTDRDRARREV